MAKKRVKIVVFTENGTKKYPEGKIEFDSKISTIISDLREFHGFNDEFELFVKADPNKLVKDYDPSSILIIARKIRENSSIDLEEYGDGI